LRILRYRGELRSFSWSPEADIGVGVDVDFVVGRATMREIQWACQILVVRLRAALRGVKNALLQRLFQVCESYPGFSSPGCCSLGSFGVEFRI
jgi:hypothetical protein